MSCVAISTRAFGPAAANSTQTNAARMASERNFMRHALSRRALVDEGEMARADSQRRMAAWRYSAAMGKLALAGVTPR